MRQVHRLADGRPVVPGQCIGDATYPGVLGEHVPTAADEQRVAMQAVARVAGFPSELTLSAAVTVPTLGMGMAHVRVDDEEFQTGLPRLPRHVVPCPVSEVQKKGVVGAGEEADRLVEPTRGRPDVERLGTDGRGHEVLGCGLTDPTQDGTDQCSGARESCADGHGRLHVHVVATRVATLQQRTDDVRRPRGRHLPGRTAPLEVGAARDVDESIRAWCTDGPRRVRQGDRQAQATEVVSVFTDEIHPSGCHGTPPGLHAVQGTQAHPGCLGEVRGFGDHVHRLGRGRARVRLPYGARMSAVRTSPRFLVVAATRAEAAHVPASLPLVITGIGKTPAAAHTAKALAGMGDLQGVTVLNVGTAGALRPGLVGLFTPGVVLNHDINADAIRALGHDPQERLVVEGDDTVLATGDVFVTDPVVRDGLAGRAHLVDMEGYAVAWTARQFGASVRLAKHVSDNADESALDWPSVVAASAKVLGEWVTEQLDG